MIVSTEAIILHSRKYSDTSAILTVYTPEYGKVGLVVKGSRRPKSKFGANVMPLSIVDAVFYYKPGRELHTMSGADPVLRLSTLSNSYDHLSVGLAICEALMLTQPMGEKNTALYELLRSTLIVLNSTETQVYSFFVFFCIHLAEIMGFMIDLSLEDEAELVQNEGNVFFSFENGAPRRDADIPGFHVFRLRLTTLRQMSVIAAHSLTHVSSIVLSEAEQREIHHFFVSYFSYHLEKRIVFRVEQMVRGV